MNRFLAARLLEAWCRIRFAGEVADRAVAQIAKRDRLGGRDRRRLAEAVFLALRMRGLIDAALGADAARPDAAQHWLNTALQQRIFEAPVTELPPPGEDPVQDGNLPPTLVAQRGDIDDPAELLALGIAMQGRAPVTLRFFGGRRDEVMADLTAEGLAARPCLHAPNGLLVEDGRALQRRGDDPRYTVQDEGSQLLLELPDLRPGLRVLDACAGAGGKTLALLDAGCNVVAADVVRARLRRLKARCRAHGFSTPHCVELRASGPLPELGTFDLVLVDAPCTGSGTGRRAPDLLWRFDEQRCAEFVATQREILERFAPLVRPGGQLLYATCSLSPRENHEQAEAFAAAHPEFQPLAAAEQLGDGLAQLTNGSPWLELRPDRHGTDGFFGALFARQTSA